MPRLPLQNVKPGMVISRDIYSDSGLFLMTKDSVVSQLCLKRLVNMNVHSVHVVPTQEALQEITCLETVNYTKEAINSFDRTHSINIAGMDRFLEKTINNILGNRVALSCLHDIRLSDMATYVHSINVSLISTLIGMKMHLGEQELHDLGLAAILHDVGMASVSQEIMNKKDRLTLEEWGTLQDHTRLGYNRLAKEFTLPKTCCIVAGQHHENYDGSGYPLGMSGESIHQHARITTVADVYDSMVSKKTFSSVTRTEKVCEVMLGIGGLMLDSGIVNKFMENIIPRKKQEQSIWSRLASELSPKNQQRNMG